MTQPMTTGIVLKQYENDSLTKDFKELVNKISEANKAGMSLRKDKVHTDIGRICTTIMVSLAKFGTTNITPIILASPNKSFSDFLPVFIKKDSEPLKMGNWGNSDTTFDLVRKNYLNGHFEYKSSVGYFFQKKSHDGRVFTQYVNSPSDDDPATCSSQVARLIRMVRIINIDNIFVPADSPEASNNIILDNNNVEAPEEDKSPKIPSLVKSIRSLRAYCEEKAKKGSDFDTVSMRPIEYGAKMLKQGIPEDAILYAITQHWPEDAKKANNIKEYDVKKFKADQRVSGKHVALPYLIALHDANVPAALYGPKGTGKSTLAKHLAEIKGKDFGIIPMTGGATPSWLTGAYTLDGYKTRPFVELYENGGVFLFDEMDAADPNMLLIVNNAISSDEFFNPVTGQKIIKHKDFYPVAAMNTIGLGANRAYTGRERLDAATIDRFSAGRIKLELDEDLELKIFESIMDSDNG